MKLRLTDNGLVETKLSTSKLFQELCQNADRPLCEYEPWVSDSFQRLVLHPNVLLPDLSDNLCNIIQLFEEPNANGGRQLGGGVVMIDAPSAAVGSKLNGYVFYVKHIKYHPNGGSFSVEFFQLSERKMQPYYDSYERKKIIDEMLKTL